MLNFFDFLFNFCFSFQLTVHIDRLADEEETKLEQQKTSLEGKLSRTQGHQQLLEAVQRTPVLTTLIAMSAQLEQRLTTLETLAAPGDSTDPTNALSKMVLTDKTLTKLQNDITALADVAMVSSPRCFLDVSTCGVFVGRIVLALFGYVVPRTAENFRALCTGEEGYGYADTMLYNVIEGQAVYGGLIPHHEDDSIYGGLFEDESFEVRHDRPYLLSTGNSGRPDSNGTKFCITMATTPSRDGKTVVFGEVVQGRDVVKRICSTTGRDRKKKKKTVCSFPYIVDACGQL